LTEEQRILKDDSEIKLPPALLRFNAALQADDDDIVTKFSHNITVHCWTQEQHCHQGQSGFETMPRTQNHAINYKDVDSHCLTPNCCRC